MAQAFSTLTALMNKQFDDSIAHAVNQSTVLPRFLPKKAGTNQVIQWVARLEAASTATTANDGAAAPSPGTDTKATALLNYGRYTDAFSVTGFSVAAAMRTGNPADLADLFGEEMSECARRLAVKIAQDIYSGTGATNIIAGLTDSSNGAIMDVGTYAALARGTYDAWKGNVYANGGINRALSEKLVNTVLTGVLEASGETPDLIVTTPKLFQKYGESFSDRREYHDTVRTAAGEIKLSGGFKALDHAGIPIVRDVNCPANTMLFLNTRHINLMHLPAMTPVAGRMGAGETGLAGSGEADFGQPASFMNAKVQPLGVLGDNYVFQVVCYPQLQVRLPNTCGVLQDLAE